MILQTANAQALLSVDKETVSSIGRGLMVLVGIGTGLLPVVLEDCQA